MKVNHLSWVVCLLLSLWSGQVYGQNDATVSKPNIVLFLVDDAGLMDFSAFGGEAQTPNIDRLAAEGMMFTNMHASPVCAPSRAMLMTGTDSHLTGVANLPEMLPAEYQDKPGYRGILNNRVQTIATRLKEANYNTYVSGKWHLGHDENTLPNKRGFDRSFILGSSGGSNFKEQGYLPMKPQVQWFENGVQTSLPEDFYSSKTYIDKAIAFHEEEQNVDAPFFSFVSFQAIHAPVQAPAAFVNNYRTTYAMGWDKLRETRFEKAKAKGLIPNSAKLNDVFPDFRKWSTLTKEEQEAYITDMAVTAGMIEAMDFHIGRYISYLAEKDLLSNTIFIVTSDNGPDGANYHPGMNWARSQGYHREFDESGDAGYYGIVGPEFANALSSPFSYYKYYTGEGGLRVPLVISGADLPQNVRSDAFCFFTDIAPTIYDWAGLSTTANAGYAPVTGKSMLPHIQDRSQAIYQRGEGVGLEAANSSAYFLDGYKIVKNNIPYGDCKWHLYHIESDPGETKDLAAEKPELFQKMLAAYKAYAEEVGVIEMPDWYSAEGEVERNSMKALLKARLPFLVGLGLCGVLLIGFLVRRLLIWRRS